MKTVLLGSALLIAAIIGGTMRVSPPARATVNNETPVPDQASANPAPPASVPAPAPKPKVQLALLLDTSNSMDGLIAQAKTQLWRMVNQFIGAKRGGASPELQVALYEYGKKSLTAESGFVRQIVPFTTDLDKVSQELFALTTNGGEEYCGWVIREAVNGLDWTTDADDYKAIIIAGNEPFQQGPVAYLDSCKAASDKNIYVNTIHCGAYDKGVRENWEQGALVAGGRYMNIDQNRVVAEISTPMDKDLARLGTEINNTYIAFGANGKAGLGNQVAQDGNSKGLSVANFADRAMCKSSTLYRNDSWDLVDAQKSGTKLEELKDDQLPEEMRKMTLEQRRAYVESKQNERTKIQAEMSKLSADRTKYISEESKKRAEAGEKTLDEALIKAVKEQCQKKNFEF